jgi:long-chain acyl-CoA synthetase
MMVKRDGVYQDLSWSEFYSDVERLSTALVNMGMSVNDRVAIMSNTRFEWAIADSAALTAGGLTVPIYPTLLREEVIKLLARSRSSILFLESTELIENPLELIDKVDELEKIILIDRSPGDDPSIPTLKELAASTEPDHDMLDKRLQSLNEDDVATIIFTSGTTGDPKGVQLTHKNLLSNVENILKVVKFNKDDICLSHLPLAHIFERMAGYYSMLYCGATIAYAESIQTVASDLTIVQPTACISVPRIFEKIFAAIENKALESSPLVRALTFWAIDVAEDVGEMIIDQKPLPLGKKIKHAIADKLVFSKVRAKFGGKIVQFVSGGAPLSPEMAIFFFAAGIPILEGYGLTETSPVITANTHEHRRVGTVGKPIPGVEVKIAEDGEIITRGDNVFKGYYENEEATNEVLSADGWFHTGDIGEIDSDGYLKITDRKKDLIVTAAGKNIAPQKVENILKFDRFISQVMLYGDKLPFISAVVVPDFEWLASYAKQKNIKYDSIGDLVKNPKIIDLYYRRIDKLQREHHLASYESVKQIVLLDHEFTMDGGEVTPTLKLKRKMITEHYADQLAALYKKD